MTEPIQVTVIDLDNGTYRWEGPVLWEYAMLVAQLNDYNMPSFQAAFFDAVIHGSGMFHISADPSCVRHIPLSDCRFA